MSVVVEKAPVRRWRRSFTAEFKRDAVAMVLDDERSVAEVAKALGSARRTWGTGFARNALIVVNEPD
jgi:Transposase